MPDPRCIGVFDSGLGGLTVVRALRRRLPEEEIVYFGDTARVPYGIKSRETVVRFAREDCEFLLRFNPKLIVAACNTASAAALPEIEEHVPVPICGVVLPGAKEAVRLADGRPVGVLATESTVNSNAYVRAMRAIIPGLPVFQRACPLFVPLVEEGRDPGDPIVKLAAQDYLRPMVSLNPHVVVLGCTHYPLLRRAISEVLGPDVHLVDSAEQTARAVVARLEAGDALASRPDAGTLTCYVSDNPARFREVGQRFLGEPIVSVTSTGPDDFHSAEQIHV